MSITEPTTHAHVDRPGDPLGSPLADAEQIATTISHWELGGWALAAFTRLASSGALTDEQLTPRSDDDRAAARVLVAAGLAEVAGDGFAVARGMRTAASFPPVRTRAQAAMSTLRQIAHAVGIVTAGEAEGWAAHDDETLLAQGSASAFGGRMLASMGVPMLDGLATAFAGGGRFLDVGTGVGEIGAAFAESLPDAHVVGLDVLPRAVELARQLVARRGLAARFEVRLQPVEELDDDASFDLAWLPAPFIPRQVFSAGVSRIASALRPGGWLVVGAGRFDGDPLAIEVTRWQTLRAGGTPLSSADAHVELAGAGLEELRVLPTPAGAPALYAARRPFAAGR